MRNAPFIDDPDKYFASIIRFHVDTAPSSLPVFIPAIQTGQSDVNLTQYSYTLKYKTYEYQKYIEFVSQNTAESIPAAPTIKQDISNEYYYVHSFAYWVGLCNASLVECFDGLKALVLAGSDTMPTLYAPWIQYDPSSSSLIFNCDKSAYDESLTNPIEIYLNAPMANLFNSFQMICKGFSGIVNGKTTRVSSSGMFIALMPSGPAFERDMGTFYTVTEELYIAARRRLPDPTTWERMKQEVRGCS
jgi:hypothetical protein